MIIVRETKKEYANRNGKSSAGCKSCWSRVTYRRWTGLLDEREKHRKRVRMGRRCCCCCVNLRVTTIEKTQRNGNAPEGGRLISFFWDQTRREKENERLKMVVDGGFVVATTNLASGSSSSPKRMGTQRCGWLLKGYCCCNNIIDWCLLLLVAEIFAGKKKERKKKSFLFNDNNEYLSIFGGKSPAKYNYLTKKISFYKNENPHWDWNHQTW